MKKIKSIFLNLFTIIFSLFFILYLLEIFIFLHKNNYVLSGVIKLNTFNYDKKSRVQILKEKRKINSEIILSIYPFNFLNEKNQIIFPLSSKSLNETIFCNENGYYSIYKSDRYGFNNNDMMWDADKIDYILLGDSFGQGQCVFREDNIASNLQKIKNKNVLNLSQSGNGPIIQYATLKEYTKKIKFENLIWLYFEDNDLSDLKLEKENNILNNYFVNELFTQDLIYKQKQIDRKILNYHNEKIGFDGVNIKENYNPSYFLRFIKLFTLREFLKNTFINLKKKHTNYSREISEFEQILIKTKNICPEEICKIYFVYLPTYARYNNPNNYVHHFDEIKKIVNKNNINFIDIPKKIQQNIKNPLSIFPFGFSGHYNVYGYKKISEFIAEEIN